MHDSQEQNLETSSADAVVDGQSQPFVGRWNSLVSTTNWEKGRIIRDWREALIAAGADAAEYSDDAWAAHVGNVSSQHVGRLRRVSLRFGDVETDYEGLFWSHFFAALDWNDAEMWLEGALQNKWSVSQVRAARWEALGAPDDLKPSDEDVIVAELDEDVDDPVAAGSIGEAPPFDPVTEAVRDPGEADAPQSEPREDDAAERQGAVASRAPELAERDQSVPRARPFENLAALPDDLAEAFETFKLAILHHKLSGWQEIPRDDVLASLEALKELALAPSDD